MQIYYPEYIEGLSDDSLTEADILYYINEMSVKSSIDENPYSENINVWTKKLLRRIFQKENVIPLEVWMKNILLSVTFKILTEYDKHPEQKEFWLREENNTMKWRPW